MSKHILQLLRKKSATPVGALANALEKEFTAIMGGIDSNIGRQMVATEGFAGEAAQRAADSTIDQLNEAIKSACSSVGIAVESLTEAQQEAMVLGALATTNLKAFASVQPDKLVEKFGAHEGQFFQATDSVPRKLAMEAYDEQERGNMTVHTTAWNMASARQDPFTEKFFPTIVVGNNEAGLAVQVRMMAVLDDAQHDISGDLAEWNRRNLLRIPLTPSLLKNAQNQIIPVVRPESEKYFADPALVPPTVIVHDGVEIETAPLAFTKNATGFSLLGISQTDELVSKGLVDYTDSIVPDIRLKNIYVKLGAKVVKLHTENLTLSNFTPAQQGQHRDMVLNFDQAGIVINKETKAIDNSPLAAPYNLITNNSLVLKLKVQISGKINIQFGDTTLSTSGVGVSEICDEDGKPISLTTGDGKTIADALATAELVGYDLYAFRTNLNHRQRGDIIDTSYYTHMYGVPLLGPITSLKPLSDAGQDDGSNLATLIFTTQQRLAASGMAKLKEVENTLRTYAKYKSTEQFSPSLLGVGNYLVRPAFIEEEIDFPANLDSLTADDRMRDIQATLIDRLRDIAHRLYRDSAYMIAQQAVDGSAAVKPTIIIGCGIYVARYLTLSGELRTLGDSFPFEVVVTPNEEDMLSAELGDKVIIAFGRTGSSLNSKPDALHFGCTAWKTEVVTTIPMPRNGQISRELTVQPSFRHIHNCPIMGILRVKNLPEVIGNKVVVMTKVAP